MHHFVSENEIVILEDAPQEYKTIDCNQPFYINESIDDLNKVLKLCADVSYNRTPIREIVSWDKFCLLWALMFSIYKQREMGRKISDLEYLYEKYKNKYNIILTKTSQLDLKFTIEEDVIVGESMLNIFEKLIKKLDLTYNYEYMIFSKTYWKKGWMKHDELLKHKGPISEIDKDALLQIKDECNSFSWECKYKRKFVIQISFSSCISFEDNTVNHYSINFDRYDEMYAKEFIKDLAQIVKEGIGAKDEIIIKTPTKLSIQGGEVLEVVFNDFE